ncbi:F-box protein At3g07870-like [Papaver somniferum]|uniref:F-box protein At3g07870-like n=1 Tax=Papaver somniferum TaxID=3469 RepID=UPI000E70265D|nr:F-box protein At3g07870-like [Papaver somniferum]
MEKLPTEMEENILSRLTMEAALPAKQVCKKWRIFLRSKTDKVGLLFTFTYGDQNKNKLSYCDQYDPILGKMNYNYSYDSIQNIHLRKFVKDGSYINNILGSCNGLVCFGPGKSFKKDFFICNPFTGEVVYVPVWENWSCFVSGLSGFGYCHSTNEYKIVSMHEIKYQDRSNFQVLIYTIGGGGWRSKGSIQISPSDSAAAGIYANGALHWLREKDKILAFDLEDENFQVIRLPRFEYMSPLRLLGGNYMYLVSTSSSLSEPYCMDIWAYKRKHTNAANGYNGVKEKYNYSKNSWNWIKQFSIKLDKIDWWFLKPLAITRNDKFLLGYTNETLYSYGLKTSTKNEIFNGRATGCNRINVIPHANSIVSIMSKSPQEVQVFL